jgi:hypothetical protein
MKRMLSLAVLLVGCAPGLTSPESSRNPRPERYTSLNQSPRPMKARAAETVTIYRTQVPAARYVEVSELVDTGEDETEALDTLKLSAAGIGCDGLILGVVRPERAAMNFGTRRVNIAGTCIMFEQDPGTWRPSEIDARCAADRDRLFAAKDPEQRAAIARSMPPDCHR